MSSSNKVNTVQNKLMIADYIKHHKDILEKLGNPISNQYNNQEASQDEIKKIQQDLDKTIQKTISEKDRLLTCNKGKLDAQEVNEILQAITKFKQSSNLSLQNSLVANTLKIFTTDLYKDKFHFFMELLQNADDASKGGDNHELKITLHEKGMTFEYDERGFNFSDVWALTSIGQSTKTNHTEDDSSIGEKGIGFKSIFSIVERVNISSKFFSFGISATNDADLTSILQPSYFSHQTNAKTKVEMILRDQEDSFFNDLHEWINGYMEDTKAANPFLFLKHITKLTYENKRVGVPKKSINIIRQTVENSKFNTIQIGEKLNFLVYSGKMEFHKEAILDRWPKLKDELEEKKIDTIHKPCQVAFPINPSSDTKGKIYSYLPTNIRLDMPIYINLDVHLTASRGNISASDFAGSEWNNKVKENLHQFLIDAYQAVIDTHKQNYYLKQDDDLKQNESLKTLRGFLKTVRESLYQYIPTQLHSAYDNGIRHIYKNELDEFIDEVKKLPIILDNNDQFQCLDKIKPISSRLRYANNNEIVEVIYRFIGDTKIPNDLPFPKSENWNKLAMEISDGTKYYTIYDFILEQEGFVNYGYETEDKKDDLKVIIKILKDNIDDIKGRKDYQTIQIIPIEDATNKFSLKSREEIKKALFMHAENQEVVEDVENSVYIYKDFMSELNELVCVLYDIRKYDLREYFKKEFEDLSKPLSENSLNEFINKTFRFYCRDNKCFGMENPLKEISNYLCKRTLSLEDWKYYTTEEKELSYLEALQDLSSLERWSIPAGEEDKCEYIKYLIWLGIKSEIKIEGGKLDSFSQEILQINTFQQISLNKQLEMEVHNKLQEYYLIFLDFICNDTNKDKINNENLLESCEELGVFIKDSSEYKYNNKKIMVMGKEHIHVLKEYIYNSTDYQIVSNNKYSSLLNEISKKEGQNKGILNQEYLENNECTDLINSFYFGEKFIDRLHFFDKFNLTFKKAYRWPQEQGLDLSLMQFLSCYDKLNENLEFKFGNKSKLGDLMETGYKITMPITSIKQYFMDDGGDIIEFTQHINEMLSDYIINCEPNLDSVGIIELDQMQAKYIIFDENNKTTQIRSIVKKQPKQSDILINVYDIFEIKMPEYIKKEIQDYFGELDKPIPLPLEVDSLGVTNYCTGVFFDFHIENIEIAIKQLANIWKKKEILKQLCHPFRLTDNQIMEGYGYICPICGKKSLSALSGMKFDRFWHKGIYPYIYIVSCLDCHNTLKYAKSIEIKEFEAVCKNFFENCYCVDNNHIQNKNNMMTVDLMIEIWDGTVIRKQMKISYLNMILYKSCYDKLKLSLEDIEKIL